MGRGARDGHRAAGRLLKAQVEVPRPQSESHSIVAVPQSALQTLEGRATVFVQSEPGLFVRRLVDFTPREVLERIAKRIARLSLLWQDA